TGDKERLIGVLLNGMQGEIEVNGETYNNVMASYATLKDEEIAAVLTYVRSNFGNEASAVTASEVAAVRVKS
ncbi:MAG: cytochrome c, partial [Bacteroidota bacterium]